MKKYELTDETREFRGRILHRIRALIDFNDVKAGDLGGWVEAERNLSHDGDCWIYNNGAVCEYGEVCDCGVVCDYGSVYEAGRVSGFGKVYSFGKVYGCSNVYENGKVGGFGDICDNGVVCEYGEVYGHGKVCGNGVVYGHGKVCGHGVVCEYGEVYGDGEVRGNGRIEKLQDILTISKIERTKSAITFFKTADYKIAVAYECFEGNLDRFLKVVEKKHGNDKYAQIYRMAAEMAKTQIWGEK